MDPQRWQRAEAVFEAALEHEAADRAAFLARACDGDDSLRQFVARLVAAHERAGAFLSGAAPLNVLGLMASGLGAVDRQPTLPSYRTGQEFAGTERFAIRRHLGSGGMGVVYEAFDRVRAEPVALKTLKRAKPDEIVRLKREFRSLADIAHPNLVALYELVVDDSACFFTMELVEGRHFVDHVNGGGADVAGARSWRARDALIQLVDGIAHLHSHGTLHRDIKPSNILVTGSNRVVILDFGLSSDLSVDSLAVAERMAGTPAYFAPERHAGTPPSPAQDWYSVGVTLYQALTNRVPFAGTVVDILRGQREHEPVPPRDLVRDVPDDLNEICLGLLRRDPETRFTDRDVRQKLSATPFATSAQPGEDAPSAFIGRRDELVALHDAWKTVTDGGAATVYVHGPSGIGKSALLGAFCNDLSANAQTLVLKGRCYEHESVPYKAFDGIVDSLARYVRSLPRSTARSTLPPDIGALARIFPVLAGLDDGTVSQWQEADPLLVRQRAFAALRELLSRLASDRSVFVWIDDLHWADADSAVLLTELLRQPGAPALLMVLSARTAEVIAKPFLASLVADAGNCHALPLPSLGPMEAQALISMVVRGDARVTRDDLSAIAREADGNPFLLHRLARHAASSPVLRARNRSLTEVLLEPLQTLPPEAGAFLQMLALCGRPMAPEVVCEASGLEGRSRPLVHRLRASHFVRSSGSADRVEIYHDRIRETLLTSMDSDKKRRLHGQMARTLVARGLDDPEPLYEHHRGAGDDQAAAVHAAAAARKADGALAFDRAAAYYQAALELAPDGVAVRSWREGLGGALANAGRPLASAEAYLAAADLADATQHVELQRRAAEQFLVGGHIDRGLTSIGSVLRAVGLRLPATPRGTLIALACRRAQLRWRGFRYTERPAEQIAPADLVRIDTCWSVASGLALVDTLRAAHFQTRCLLLALDAGEPYRVVRSISAEVGFLATSGGRKRRATLALARRAREIAAASGIPNALALTDLADGVTAFMLGDWREATRQCERAVARFREQQAGATWEAGLAQNFLIGALSYEGRLREVTAHAMDLLARAGDHGNAYWDTEIRTRQTLVWLAQDAPQEAVRQADEGIARWSHGGFHRQHYNHVLAHAQSALYRGDAETAWRLVTANWKTISRSLVVRVQWTRIEASYVRARCALLMAASGVRSDPFLSIARQESTRIRRERMSWSDPIADLVDAAVADRRGDAVAARRLLIGAVDAFDRLGMSLYAAAARRRLSGFVDDSDAARVQGEAQSWMVREGIVNPVAMTRLIAPGFADPS